VASVGEPRLISEVEIDACRTLFNLSALAVENAQLFESARRRSDKLAALNALGRQVNQTLSLDEVVTEAIREMVEMVQTDMAFLFLREGEKTDPGWHRPQRRGQEVRRDARTPRRECMCGLAVHEGKPLYSRNIFADMRCTWKECKKAGFRSFAALPLRSGTEIIGVVGLACQAERDFEPQAGSWRHSPARSPAASATPSCTLRCNIMPKGWNSASPSAPPNYRRPSRN
jgi:transcriptional regulator with GAF, ATPase, and Fis domain